MVVFQTCDAFEKGERNGDLSLATLYVILHRKIEYLQTSFT